MTHPLGRKLRRLTMWLDDDWLARRLVPRTDDTRLVLPNGWVLPSPATPSAAMRMRLERRLSRRSHPADRRRVRERRAQRWQPSPAFDAAMATLPFNPLKDVSRVSTQARDSG